ncbi:MAG TPA: DUF6531 domain-containing protein [Candidatus Omnitrophota bacterium]|nr:DUF6531 domain-containing protein [Candidatus Omnitrophota bacterium]
MRKSSKNRLFFWAFLFAFSSLLFVHDVLSDDGEDKMVGMAPSPQPVQQAIQSKRSVSTTSTEPVFSWCCDYLYPGSPASVTWDVIYYYIYLQNAEVGDVFTWDVYNPILDPVTYLPTGSTTFYAKAAWTRIDEENWQFCSDNPLFGWVCSITYQYPFGTVEFGAGPYINIKSFVTSHPGVWRITISRNGVLLTSTNFDLIDDLAPTVTFTTPSDGSTLKGSSTTISVANSDNLAVTRLELFADNVTTGQSFLLQAYSKPVPGSFSYSWAASKFPKGDYILRAVAADPYNNIGTGVVSVSLNKGTEPPLPATEIVPSALKTLTKDPVNIATGEAYFSSTDFSLDGRGPVLSLSREYRSFSTFSGMFGYGWRTDFDVNLTQDRSGNVIIYDGDGAGKYFINNSGTYVPSPGNYSILTKNSDDTFTLKDKNGNVAVYDINGRLSFRTDRNGNKLTFVYDPAPAGGTYIQDASGRKIVLNFDSSNRVISASDPAGKTFQYGYDPNGNLSWITDPAGKVTNYFYDANHKIIKLVNSNGHNTYFTYDSQGRVVVNWQDNNVNKVTLDYLANNTTVVTDSLGNNNTYMFNSSGLLISQTDPLGAVTQQIWDFLMNRTSIKDARNNVTNFTYDSYGNLIQITDPLGKQTKMTYTPDFNLISSETDALGNITRFNYDSHGNLTDIVDALGNSHSFIYDQFGNVIKSTDSRGNSANFTYDALNHVIQKTDALGNIINFTYE